jgi:pimeloyl-ACP methyl ester carboxylesterase
VHIGWVVAASLATGFAASLLLVAIPFIPAEESGVTGALLLGFALGWAMLAVLSVRFTDQPQRWAAAPAVFMGLGGVLLVGFGSSAHPVLDWVWPPALLTLAIWMLVRVHRRLHSRCGRVMLYPVIGLLAVAAIGGAYQTVGAASDASAYPMRGQLIDVGGHRMHLNCTGSGSPTVILQPGLGEMSSNMGWIAPAVAKTTRVCVYDRAGRGWSEPWYTPQDGARIADDLHTLLHRARVPGPYVLAGHSFGGRYVLAYAARYPDDVAGMVLVDSTAPAAASAANSPTTSRSTDSYNLMGRISALASTSARLGLGRLYGTTAFASLPPQPRGEVRASLATADNLRSVIDEFVQGNASAQEAAALTGFADRPLIVLTAGIDNTADHEVAQNHLATLSTNSAHRTIATADHQGLIADEQGSGSTTRAILDVVGAVRSHTRLR